MRVPASSDSNSTGRNLVRNNEQSSVLDLRRSPSPATAEEKPVITAAEIITGVNANQFPLDDHVMRSMDWESGFDHERIGIK